MKSTHPLAPDVYELAESCTILTENDKANMQRPIDPEVSVRRGG